MDVRRGWRALWFVRRRRGARRAVRGRPAGAGVYGAGRRAGLARGAGRRGCRGHALLANIALYRHDAHLDLTREQAFTPSARGAARSCAALQAAGGARLFLPEAQIPPAARPSRCWSCWAGSIRSSKSRRSTSTSNPARASRSACGSTTPRSCAPATAASRSSPPTTARSRSASCARCAGDQPLVCFATGHGEYDIDNFEFHTHFEGAQGHSHDAEGMARGADGAARARPAAPAIEKLGLVTRKVTLAAGRSGAGRLRRAGRGQPAHAAMRRPRPRSCARYLRARRQRAAAGRAGLSPSSEASPACWPRPARGSATASWSTRPSIISPTSR